MMNKQSNTHYFLDAISTMTYQIVATSIQKAQAEDTKQILTYDVSATTTAGGDGEDDAEGINSRVQRT